MNRNNYITEELFVRGSLLDKRLNFLIDLGYKYQGLSKLHDLSSGLSMSGVFNDHDVFASGYLSYSIFSLLAPFAGVRLSHDLNEDPDFNSADIRAGLEGNYRLNNSFRLIYQAYYKRLESRMVNENDRVVVNARIRANVVPRFDLFFDGYFEYSFNEGKAFFINRNLSLSGRLWFFEKKLNISSGLTLIFDHNTVYVDDGPQKEKIFVPLWPFLMSELYLYNSGSVIKNFRGVAKVIAKVGESGTYEKYSFIINGGLISQIGYIEPFVFFRWNSSGAQTLKTMGIDLGFSIKF